MTSFKRHLLRVVASGTCVLLWAPAAPAITTMFFNPSQTATVVSSNITAVTISSGGYLFTYSQDGYFTGGLGGGPIGRFFTVVWPNGVQAQAYTEGPLIGTGANITIKRADGNLFDLQSFTGKILLNTAGAGGAFEIMPQLNGNDAFANPLQYDCTGYAGNSFPYTTALTGYDTYLIHMWGDFALTQLTLVDASVIVQPTLQISLTSSNYVRLNWPTNSTGFTLQQNSVVGTTNWVDATNSVNVVATNNQVILPALTVNNFFRLYHP
jgi:hypothetical protein